MTGSRPYRKFGKCTCPDCLWPDEPTWLVWHPEGGPDYSGGYVCDGCEEMLDEARERAEANWELAETMGDAPAWWYRP